jgi:hypothetical protein
VRDACTGIPVDDNILQNSQTGAFCVSLIVLYETATSGYIKVIVSEPALHQCRNITRQYAYFNKLFQVSPVLMYVLIS